MSAFDIYLFSMIPKVGNICGIICLLSIVPLIYITCIMTAENYIEDFKTQLKQITIGIIVLGGVAVLTPDKTTIAAMYIIPAAQNNENLEEIFGDSLEILKLSLDKWKEGLVNE